jgi:hypothetical protein
MTQSRRTFLARSSAVGLAAVLAPELMRNATAQTQEITDEVISRAEQLAGLQFTEEERELMRASVADHVSNLRAIADLKMENHVPPAMLFKPLGLEWAMSHYPGNRSQDGPEDALAMETPVIPAGPPAGDDLAFATVRQIGDAIRRGELSCTDVTEFFIERL